MIREIEGKAQNTISIAANEDVKIVFVHEYPLEFLNMAGSGQVWIKWHGDCRPTIGGETSTPIPPDTGYQRNRFWQSEKFTIGIIAEEAATLCVNIL